MRVIDMAYHTLTQESGGDENSSIEEAHTICRMLEEFQDGMSQRERDFLENMTDCDYCTTKQLFYLRDIKDRYL
jgi:hypothetical protein